ncbi:hypothetical protein V493_08486 [Pseudogymnoascus sp. VKM F-4281 (FW-2241)]|nr:hypothetical protein V493_08486 [Pseudogymnoascus sp. VKM F-4281 (FW-2241)]
MTLELSAETTSQGLSGDNHRDDGLDDDPTEELELSRGTPSGSSARRKPRSKRACDKCSFSRARCSGEYPCNRCIDYGHSCSYTRQVKRRGRRHKELPAVIPVPLTRGQQTQPINDVSQNIYSPSNIILDLPSLPAPQRQPSNVISSGPALWHGGNAGDTASLFSVPTPLPYPGTTAHGRSRSDTPSFVALPFLNERRSRSDANTSSTCRYPILIPLLPVLADIVSASVACDLLEAYFDTPGSSLVEFGSPYVVTHVLRRRAVLHRSHPRTTSSALLLSMLHATAHTADIACFHAPGSRAIVCDKLYSAVVRHLDDPDGWHRLLNGRWVELGRRGDGSAEGGISTNDRGEGEHTDSPDLSTDVLLTIVLMTVVVSGGTFKADCLRWWNKALRLARVLKLSELDEGHASEAVNPSFSETVAAEEKRRVFWLIFCLDRHLALSYNAPLAIHDAGISVYLPMPEALWENLDLQTFPVVYQRSHGPKTTISGTDFFEFFLPLMTILGDIVLLHHRRLHPRFGALSDVAETAAVESLLNESEHSLEQLRQATADREPTTGIPGSTSSARQYLVIAYSTHILHVLAVLLYGKWDPLEILGDPYTTPDSTSPGSQNTSDDWTIPARFMKGTSHAISASQAVSTIMALDPELVFMPPHAAARRTKPGGRTGVRDYRPRARGVHRDAEYGVSAVLSEDAEDDAVSGEECWVW